MLTSTTVKERLKSYTNKFSVRQILKFCKNMLYIATLLTKESKKYSVEEVRLKEGLYE